MPPASNINIAVASQDAPQAQEQPAADPMPGLSSEALAAAVGEV